MTDNFDQAMYDEAVQRMESALSQVPEFHMSFDTVWLEFISDYGGKWAKFTTKVWKDLSTRFQKLLDNNTKGQYTPLSSSLLNIHNRETIGLFRELFESKFSAERSPFAKEFYDESNKEYSSIINRRVSSVKENILKDSLLPAFDNLVESKIAKVRKVYKDLQQTETSPDFFYGCQHYYEAWLSTRRDDKPMQFPYEDE